MYIYIDMANPVILKTWDVSGVVVDGSTALISAYFVDNYIKSYLGSWGKEAVTIGVASFLNYEFLAKIIKSLDSQRSFFESISFDKEMLKDLVLYGGGSSAIYSLLRMIFPNVTEAETFKRYAIILTSILGSKLLYPKLKSMLGWTSIIEKQ